MPDQGWTDRLIDGLPLTGAGFIVTVYGDVVVPRGEVLWMGSLIALCAQVGLGESVVRTAVSRLVAAGRLQGERIGRRSYYRLAPDARSEFAMAARMLFNPPEEADRWLVLLVPGLGEDAARRSGLARIAPDMWLCPDHGQPMPAGALVLRAEVLGDCPDLARLAAFWDLQALRRGYEAMVSRFHPLSEALESGVVLTPRAALIARLLLVHVYRGVVLRDPGLPGTALPPDWPGGKARALFCRLYLHLSDMAERAIAQDLIGLDAPLAAGTELSRLRIQQLAKPEHEGKNITPSRTFRFSV